LAEFSPRLAVAVDGRSSRRSSLARDGAVRAAATGGTVGFLSLVVLLPVAALVATAARADVREVLAAPQARAALAFTVVVSLIVTAVDLGTGLLVAWVLVRDDFPGRRVVDVLVDLPFALPTIVAGLTLLALYGQDAPLGLDLAYRRSGVVLALLFVTLPFVVRGVQPVLAELDTEMEEAAVCLGASGWTTFRRIVLPALRPALLTGAGLAFARSLGEFGSVVLISGNLPFKTEVASVFIAGQVENGDAPGAAAVSVVLLATSLLFVLGLRGLAWRLGRGR
jgi:sulfate/thiosulfate transport system permease protein